jgi:hypothetical protein
MPTRKPWTAPSRCSPATPELEGTHDGDQQNGAARSPAPRQPAAFIAFYLLTGDQPLIQPI